MSMENTRAATLALSPMIADAEAGKPVYISRVHSSFATLPEEGSDRIVLLAQLLGAEGEKAWELRVPKLGFCSVSEKKFVREYVFAEIYNILSGMGARLMTIFVDTDSRELIELTQSLKAAFCVDMPRAERSGYGRAINVLDRMIAAVRPGETPFHFEVRRLSPLPELARLGAAEPGAEAPDATAPYAKAPASIIPGATAPDARAPESDEPGATAPESDESGATAPESTEPGATAPNATAPRKSGDSVSAFRRCTAGLEDKAFCGIDVGGTDIKAVLVDDGGIVDYKEYDWFPASFLRSRQLVDPILLLTRLLQARLWIHRMPLADGRREKLLKRIALAMDKNADDTAISENLASLKAEGFDEGGLPGEVGGMDEKARPASLPRFDGIGLCFPDVVVRNKIVGGEVYKTRGIRNNPSIDYESDFAELTELDTKLKAWVKPEGVVRIINDGPMASFTAAVEIAAYPDALASGYADGSARASEVADGVFAHTLGTELGTGWVTETGAIPDIPLEVYNFIIDLGSWPERAYEPDDLRSVNNFNTGLPGTLQKYCSQSGVFRLAMKYFPAERPDLFQELRVKGYIEWRKSGGANLGGADADRVDNGGANFGGARMGGGSGGARIGGAKIGDDMGWYVPTEPVDQRKPFLEHMMKLPDRENDEVNRRIWREIGEFLAVTLLETKRVFNPGTDERFLFGRLVKNRTCFDLMVEGGRSLVPDIALAVAGTDMANTALMKELERHPEHTVAQFAQAIGAVYFANSH